VIDVVRERNQLLQAYKNALYVARLPHAVVELRVGETCPLLIEWLAGQGLHTAAFLTAFNPRSEICSLQENETAHARLLADIASMGLVMCDGYGAGEGGDWPREISVLVLGISREQAQRLAEKFAQNAFLFVQQGGEVQLCLSESFARQSGKNLRQT